ncbi:MAG: hypothetical protein ACHQ4H_14345, partial [Ktedonobacterales bacterium]
HDDGLIARAALETLAPDERLRLDAQLIGCSGCRTHLGEYRMLLDGLGQLMRPAAGAPVETGVRSMQCGRDQMPTFNDNAWQRRAPASARTRRAHVPSALAGALVATLLIAALVGVYAVFGPGRGLGAGTPGVAQSCANVPTPHAVGDINNAIGGDPFWVGGFFGGFAGHHATLDVQGAQHWPHGQPAKVVTQFAPGATAPVTLTGKRLDDGSPLWFQFYTGIGPAAPQSMSVVFNPASSANEAGYIVIPATGCYALTARWASGSWTVAFDGIV